MIATDEHRRCERSRRSDLGSSRGRWGRGARAALLGLPLALAPSCASTGGLNFFSVDDDIQLGAEAYEHVLEGERILTSGPEYDMVQRVTQRLVVAAQQIDPELEDTPNDLSQRFDWEVRVIDNPDTVNAFCLPGGKMAVYTGILPVAGSDDGLAVVMGHEIAHATLRHGTQRVSRNMGVDWALGIIGAVTRTEAHYLEMGRLVANLGLGLPFSRDNELEADRVGLKYMAQAGYDPREAVGFWSRMAELAGGAKPPELLSTHPSDSTRIRQIEGLLPEALEIYERQRGLAPGSGLPPEGFRRMDAGALP